MLPCGTWMYRYHATALNNMITNLNAVVIRLGVWNQLTHFPTRMRHSAWSSRIHLWSFPRPWQTTTRAKFWIFNVCVTQNDACNILEMKILRFCPLDTNGAWNNCLSEGEGSKVDQHTARTIIRPRGKVSWILAPTLITSKNTGACPVDGNIPV